ncbi:DNA-binding protein [Chryseobacterium aahli]|uniref:PPC domain-containing DNA-binding protein n=1 Tax=Chryseobacterium aahli TaxID=1278643 RepID=UPI001F60FECE|nr:PPC domain-containing DNA-binding protein [Chryseobacterium aahli]MCI3936107.1 DNA-binding protein [Chryseobacterium aahli]
MKERILEGELWTAKKIENNYIVSIKDKSSIVQALHDFVLNQNIKSGQVTGIGAVSEATLRFFDFSTKDYVDKKFDEQMEVTNISGNVSVAEDKPLLHTCILLWEDRITRPLQGICRVQKFGERENFSFILWEFRFLKLKMKTLELFSMTLKSLMRKHNFVLNYPDV